MPVKTKTQIPAHPDDLICDTCPERYPFRGSPFRTMEWARAAGWHIHQEPDLSFRMLCPSCIGTPRTRIPVPEVLEGQIDALEELGVTVTPQTKEKKRKDHS